jgi:hypothetical protein
MPTVKVDYGRGYDIINDKFHRTKRRGRIETLRRLGLDPIGDTDEVDDSELDGDGFVKSAGPEAFIAANRRGEDMG